ncbi:FMN-linked oxidoreductase [Rhizodiscina lignyota]|uniref:FMN-linked oxidoreductase n=1 Tax=Rhizodiscina lignyota TaxID=1504668 RepID=A0A9P4I618_9PEZI|nr:FMN-linked oxidoreductase [Rhizodiscina lignyota]
MVLSYIIIAALADAYPVGQHTNRAASIVQIIFIYVIQMAYAGALGPVAWIYASEIFPTHLRDKGVNISQAGQQTTTLWINQAWPVMFQNVGHNAYWILVAINAFGCAMVILFWPETKGISLEHMDKLFGEVDKVEGFTEEHRANSVAEEREFRFISIQNPADAKDRGKRRVARSHAIKQAWQNKGSVQQASSGNDVVESGRTLAPWSIFAPASAYGPFETLFGDSPRLKTLISQGAARQSAEPVFSVADPVVFQDFGSVFRSDIDDPALLNAVKLTFAFAVMGGNVDQECLGYQNEAMSTIRQRMSSPETALSLPTLGAILLLADLNSSIMTGSDRIVNYTTFAELQWIRDPFSTTFFVLPPGFQKIIYLFSEDFIEVLKDIHALKCVQDIPGYSCQNPIEMLRVDNQQASIGSRLVDLPKLSAYMEACYLAAYLSACMLCCKVWRHSVMPSHVSVHLLHKLQESNNSLFWNDHPDLLIWMLHLGGSFSSKGEIRSQYKALIQINKASRFRNTYRSLEELIRILNQFIWSEKAYRAQVEVFWREIQTVSHRIGMPGLSRFRGTDDHTATPMMKEYYSQRSQVPGTLIITEAGLISPGSGGYPNAPGIWREDQVAAWKTITDEVHRNGCFIICQIFHIGRAAVPEIAEKEGIEIVSASAIPYEEGASVPKALTVEEIKQIVRDFVAAAKNAIRAGFDGIELHAGNGYLIDSFIQDVSNIRSDEYGGNVENRSRFIYEVMEAVGRAIGPERVGIRLSPWSTFQGMRMKEPIPQFSDVIRKAKLLGLSYIHLIEPRVSNNVDLEHPVVETLDFAIDLWNGPILLAGGYNPDNAQKTVDEKYPNKDIMVMFGRHFVANPDLVFRIKSSLVLNHYDRSTFYALKNPMGYLDYPFSNEFLASTRA